MSLLIKLYRKYSNVEVLKFAFNKVKELTIKNEKLTKELQEIKFSKKPANNDFNLIKKIEEYKKATIKKILIIINKWKD